MTAEQALEQIRAGFEALGFETDGFVDGGRGFRIMRDRMPTIGMRLEERSVSGVQREFACITPFTESEEDAMVPERAPSPAPHRPESCTLCHGDLRAPSGVDSLSDDYATVEAVRVVTRGARRFRETVAADICGPCLRDRVARMIEGAGGSVERWEKEI